MVCGFSLVDQVSTLSLTLSLGLSKPKLSTNGVTYRKCANPCPLETHKVGHLEALDTKKEGPKPIRSVNHN